MIVITGATGKLGGHVVNALLQTVPASELAVAVRTPSRAAHLAARGVQVREADYDRPDTLVHALRAGEKVLLISANEVGKRAPQHANVIAAARAAKVGLLVYTSLLHADSSRLLLAEEHRATEEAVRTSGLPFVILRNGWYFENHTEQIGALLERGTIIGAAGSGRFASASREDYAAAAAAVLTSDEHVNRTYELSGDSSFTMQDFAAELSKAAGRRIEYTDLLPEQYSQALVQAGFPPFVADLFVDFDLGARRGDLDDGSGTLRRLIGRPTTTLRAAIAAALKSEAPAR
ncbi:MAG TPA: SDR family oxidoreductase [Vicinamibacterales bacterium]|nr:SDR family oxidoreductase [Vicinamibacterales bacterium]